MTAPLRREFTLQLPVAADELGRWVEANGGDLHFRCMLGVWHVTLTLRKLHSYSDGFSHHEEREFSHHDRNLMTALEETLRAAGAIP